MSKPTGKEMAKQMSDFVNNFSFDSKGFVEAMANEHRTLQQSFTELCADWLVNLAEREAQGRYDLRNEASCKFAKAVVERCKDEMNFPCI